MHTTPSMSVDGRRLLRVVFERESPDEDTSNIEVVYEVFYPEDFRLDNEHAKVLVLLSATRTDTHEVVTLSQEELAEVHEAASSQSAHLTSEDFNG